ncbi:glutamate receptor ionotropic, kainate 2-like [Planococcus citri]|uniref:glutamate receptor ionotropic, kainate 2-like n=1 Tax=Planococcus citri TaxID=170843 RepID=UPI0031F73D0B
MEANFNPMRSVWIFTFLFVLEGYHCEVLIGGLFNDTGEDHIGNMEELAFNFAAHQISESYKSSGNGVELSVHTRRYFPDRNSSVANEKVCELMSLGVAGIFGPQYGDSYHIVQAICDAREIPHVQTRWDPQQRTSSCLVNLYPYPYFLAKVFPAIVEKWEWTHYLILYENTDSLVRINPLLEHEFNTSIAVKLRRIVADDILGYRPLLREIKESEESNIVLDCNIEMLPEILKQAQQIGMMGSDHSFLITNLDFHTLDLEPYQYGGANITGIRFFDPQDENFIKTIEDLNAYNRDKFSYKNEELEQIRPEAFSLGAALIYDAVFLYANAVTASLDEDSKRPVPMECDNAEYSWTHGHSIMMYMKLSKFSGLTGEIKFDYEGFRSEFSVDIVELSESGIVKVGKWSTTDVIRMERAEAPTINETSYSLKNKTFRLVLALNSPYAMRKKSYQTLTGNDQYEGFCIDLIAEISKMNDNFTVDLKIDPEGKSGTNKNGTWNGMIGFIQRGQADLACADITINREREEAVDITSPFMDLGIAILYKKPQNQSPGFFSFLSPFNTEVWILVVTAYVTVSVLFFIMGRISPYEWRNPFPCIDDPDELENQFTLSNSFWFTIGALMQQGSEIAPVSVSTRMAAGVWWFFTLIMVACYTANLAAFLTIETPSEDFTNVKELYENPEVEYGLMKNGATETFFMTSSNDLYQKMYQHMKDNADRVITKNAEEGVLRAEDVNRKYAFLMESSQIEYEMERHCTLTQVGKPIDSKGYGIAMKKDSWYLGLFSQSILKMQEEGTLNDLKRKWWKEKYATACAKDEPDEAETLGLPNLGGVFIVLGTGVLLAMVIAVFEQLFYVWSVSKEEGISMKERLKSELKFFLRCRGTVKHIGSEEDSNNNPEITY